MHEPIWWVLMCDAVFLWLLEWISTKRASLVEPYTSLLLPSPAPSLHPLASISMQTRWRTCWISVVYSGPGYSGNRAYSTRAAMSKIWAAWAETSTKPSSWITLLPPTSSTLIMLWVLICFWSLWSKILTPTFKRRPGYYGGEITKG